MGMPSRFLVCWLVACACCCLCKGAAISYDGIGEIQRRFAARTQSSYDIVGLLSAVRMSAPKSEVGWWQYSVGIPLKVGESAICLKAALSVSEKAEIRAVLLRSDADKNRTGQNLVWHEYVRFLRAVLDDDVALAHQAIAGIVSTLEFAEGEGIKSDWSFHQHGVQPQFGNYGRHYAELMTELAVLLKGTEFEIPHERLQVLRGFLQNGLRWTVWKGQMDVAALGRQVSCGAARRKANSVEQSLKRFRENIDPSLPLDSPTGFRYFDKSAYAIYRSDSWMASVKMATTKIIGAEGICGENLRGKLLCDGALFVYVSGREYDDIYPLWGTWRHIPGITAVEDSRPVGFWLKSTNECDNISVDENESETTVNMELRRDGLKVHKSWRFYEDTIICEGRNISCTDSREVVTTIQESWAAADAALLPNAGDGFVRAYNDGIGYVIKADPSDIRFSLEQRIGDFRDLCSWAKPKVMSGRVFSIVVSHGRKPSNAAYLYRICPGVTIEDLGGLRVEPLNGKEFDK